MIDYISEQMNQPWAYFGIDSIWMVLICFFVALPCSQLGSFLVLRRMSLVGDAISHSVLPGIVIAFIYTGDLSSPWLLFGAAIAGLLVTVLIEQIHQRTRIKQDSAIGIAFTSLFALGIVLMGVFTRDVHLDVDCVLEGDIPHIIHDERINLLGFDMPASLISMGGVAVGTVLMIVLFYRVLMLSSFDEGLAASYGYLPGIVHYCMMALLSVIVVSAFQAVGAILVIALLILPGATAYMCTHRLKLMLVLAGVHALISSIAGMYLHVWVNGKISAAVVVSGAALFVLAWLFGPADGIVIKAIQRRRNELDEEKA